MALHIEKREDLVWCSESRWPSEVSTVVIHCSVVEGDAAERRQRRISEQRHMSGSESVDQSVLVRAGVTGLRAADTRPSTLQCSPDAEEGATCLLRWCLVMQHTRCSFYPHVMLTCRAEMFVLTGKDVTMLTPHGLCINTCIKVLAFRW